jgi:hypothetical protein
VISREEGEGEKERIGTDDEEDDEEEEDSSIGTAR